MTNPQGLEGRILGGQYEVLSLLGQGTYATVWRARQTDVGGEVALKVLSGGYAAEPALVEDFLAQAKNFVSFRDDPRVATILGCGQDPATGLYYVAMTLLEEQVSTILEQTGPFSIARVYRLAEDAAVALKAIHGAGWVHGDIKPSNLMTVTGDDRFVLTDFLVGLVQSADGTAPTMDMNRLANWSYASPEKIKATTRADLLPASDIYSLGVVLFEVATGRLPFESKFPQIAQDHLKTVPPDPRSIRPDLPAGLAHLIQRCLAKNPSERFTTADALLEGIAASRVVPETTSPSKLPYYIGGGVAGLLALLALLLLWPRGETLELESRPEGASYRIYEGDVESRFDAIEIGETPARIGGLEEGEYTVVVEMPGYFPQTQQIQIGGDADGGPTMVVLSEMHRMRVESDPSGAEASLQALTGDRKRVLGGRTPTEFEGLRSGPHELVLRLENFATLVETVVVGRDETDVIRRLTPGELFSVDIFSSPPGCEIYIEGQPLYEKGADRRIMVTPCRIPNQQAGQLDVAFKKSGYQDFDTTFALAGGAAAETLFVELRKDPSAVAEETDDEPELTPLLRDAAEQAEASADRRVAALRDRVSNHVRRKEWREAKQALDELRGKDPDSPDIASWSRQIEQGLEAGRVNRAEEEAEAREGVRKTLARYEGALEALDIRSFSLLWVSLQPSDREKFARAMQDIRQQSIDISNASIFVSGKKATAEFREQRSVLPNAGEEIRADRNRKMELRKMGSGEWLIVSLR